MTTLSREAVAKALLREVETWPVDAGLPFLQDAEWEERLADVVMALARPENEVKAEALTEFAEEQLYDGDTDRPLSGHEAAYEAAYTFAERLRSGGVS